MALTAQKGRGSMGRFLEMVRELEKTMTLPMTQPTSFIKLPPLPAPLPVPAPIAAAERPFDAPASTVLQLLVQANRPVPHPEIVRRMERHGHDKTAAKEAIARCQKRRWIEHNLETGYVLV